MHIDDPLRASDVRAHNTKMILSAIYEAGKDGISQSSLVHMTGLKAPTLFRIFTALQEKGLIMPKEGAPQSDETARKGRKPISYTVCPDALYTVGIEFWAGYLAMGLFDFAGGRIDERAVTLDESVDIETIVRTISDTILALLEVHGIVRDHVLGIALAAPGQVNIETRTVVNYPRIAGLKNYPLAEKLETLLGIDVLIHNNCSALAYSEYRYGEYRQKGESLFTFLLRRGVNGALVTDGGIYMPPQHKTLETGHMPISFDGPLCSCGERGCLEAYLLALDDDGKGDLFIGMDKRLDAGDEETWKVMDHAARYLYFAMRSIYSLLAPSSFLIVTGSKTVSGILADKIMHLQENNDRPGSFFPLVPVFGDEYRVWKTQRGAVDLLIKKFLRYA